MRSDSAELSASGAGTLLGVAHPAVSDGLTLAYGSAGSYTGVDRFGRVVEQKWQDTQGTAVVKDQIKHGYDRGSNRLWRQVGPEMSSPPSGKDEFYGYDGLDRLLTAHRGTLTGTPFSGVSNPTFKQEWKDDQGDSGLDSLGNWRVFRQASDGGSFTGSADLTQTRTHNAVNEITGFAALADPPDPAQAARVAPTGSEKGHERMSLP